MFGGIVWRDNLLDRRRQTGQVSSLSALNPGDIIRSRFRIGRRVATGGMGHIFQATDLETQSLVAVKILSEGHAEETQRFVREISTLAQLDHPGIVRYVTHGVQASGAPYLVMEWLQGEDLAVRLARGALSVSEVLTLLSRVAETLAEAHRRGIVHRDIKPSNLFLRHGRFDQVTLLDFGIARIRTSVSLTHTGAVLGTPAYMAPEQVRYHKSVRECADIFALGCVAMECLTGTAVFKATHVMAILAKILLHEPPRLHDLRPDFPEELDALLALMMAKNPDERLQNGTALVAALVGSDSWSKAPPSSKITLQSSLTGEEQHILSLLLVEREIDSKQGSSSDSIERSSVPAEELSHLAALHRANLMMMLDGSAVVTFTKQVGMGSLGHVDVTAQAARFALALQALVPERTIALVTGRGVVRGKLPVGEAIDRAAHMLTQIDKERAREIQPILVDETSAHLLDGRFEVRRDKYGFILAGERENGTRTLLGKSTIFVGRQVEMRVIEDCWRSVVEESVPSVVLVVGSPGIGKSRLAHEFLARVGHTETEASIWRGNADALSAGSALALLGRALRAACGLEEGSSLDARRKILTERIARHAKPTEASRIAEFIGELLGIPFPDVSGSPLHAARQDARLMAEQLRRAFEDFLDAESAAHPVLLVLEDLHWGDLPTVRFIDTAVRNLPDRPIFVLALGRPEVEDRFPKLWDGLAAQKMRLRPLPNRAAAQIVTRILGEDINEETAKRIISLAEGNAFYLEELVRAAVENKDINKPATIEAPESVLAMVHSRLEALPADGRRYLRAASIFGEIFYRDGLKELVGRSGQSTSFDSVLDDLVSREVILRKNHGTLDGDVEFTFRHALIREGAYATLTESDKKLGHRLAGIWLEGQREPDSMLLAHHFERGGDALRAAGAYRRAAEQALGADDLSAAIDRAERGITCGAAGEALGALWFVQSEAHNWQGELVLSQQRAKEALELLPLASTAWYRAYQQAIDAAGKLGEFVQVEALAEVVGAVEPAVGASSARIICLSICANHLIYGGRYGLADKLIATLAENIDADRQSPQALGVYHQMRGIRASAAGDPCGFCDHHEMALPFFERAGDRRNACLIRHNLAFGISELGDYAHAETMFRALLPIAERMRLHEIAAGTLQNLGRLLALRGAFEEGRQMQQKAIDAFREHEHTRAMGLSQSYLAELEFLAGNIDIAEKHAQAAIESLAEVPPLLTGALANLARVLLAKGELQDAQGFADAAQLLLEVLGTIEEGETTVRLVYAEVLLANGRHEEFRRAISSAQQHLFAKAERIRDPIGRERFLVTIAENARTLELTRLISG